MLKKILLSKFILLIFSIFSFTLSYVYSVTVSEVSGVVTIDNGHISLSITLSNGTWIGKLDGVNVYRNLRGSFSSGGSTTGGFSSWSATDLSNSLGSGKQVVFNLSSGGTLTLQIYDNEYFFNAKMNKSGASGTQEFLGEVISNPVSSPMAWVAVYTGDSASSENHRPMVYPFGTGKQSDFAAGVFNGNDKPGLFVGTLGTEVQGQRVELSAISDGFSFRAYSNVVNGSGTGFCFVVTKRLVNGMERYAKSFQVYNNLTLTDWIPCGYCTWDAFGNGVTQNDVITIANNLVSMRLKEYGYTLIQIDDGWQYGWRQSGSWWANDKFGNDTGENDTTPGMKNVANELHNRGLKAGLWIGPLADEDDPDWRPYCWGVQHPEFINPPPGNCTGGGKYDLGDTDFIAWAPTLANKITNEWGYEYIKFDFMNGWFGNGTQTQFRQAYNLFRQGAKPGSFFLYSNARQWHAIGAIDGIRSGDDVGTTFSYTGQGVSQAIRAFCLQWYMNRKIWITDIDQIHVRASTLSEGEARIWGCMGGLSGGVLLISDKFWDTGEVPQSRLNIIKKIAPPYGVAARPVDLFEHNVSQAGDFPEIYFLPIEKSWGTYYIVGIINWASSSANKTVNFQDRFELSPTQEFYVYNFFSNTFLGTYTGQIQITVPGHDIALLALVPKTGNPQVISTDRHITQGGIDLIDVNWNAGSQQLTGTSTNVVTGVSYTITIHPAGKTVTSAIANGTAMNVTNGPNGEIRLTCTPNSVPVNWVINFGAGDTTPPADITDLRVDNPAQYSLRLTWTAPGDDGKTGTASEYDIRYSLNQINSSNFNSATPCTGEPAPKPAGGLETFTVSGLAAGTTYYFAIKTRDESYNWSGVSNSPSGRTSGSSTVNNPPLPATGLLANGRVNPLDLTDFTPELSWTFRDPDIGNTQSAYRIIVANSLANIESNTGNIWDSQKQSSQNSSVTYSGPQLLENVIYYWKVMTWDNFNAQSEFSSHAFFSISLANMPVLSVSTTTLNFGEVPINGIKELYFEIKNNGAGTLSGTIQPNEDWILTTPQVFNGNRVIVNVTVDNSILNQREGIHQGTINIDSNGGNAKVTVELSATCILPRPNPYNPLKSKLKFFGSGIVPGKTKIEIWTVTGEKIKEVSSDTLEWDGKDGSGKLVIPGIYIYTYSSVKEKGCGKITLIY